MLLLPLLAAASMSSSPPELTAYLKAADSSVTWHVEHRTADRVEISLSSGTWHGHLWRHSVVIVHPPKEDKRGVGILVITGGPTDERDVAEARDLAARSHFPVAVLFDIPNQPVEGRREDDLIAWSFQKYLETGDPTWPLLFPMTRAAIRALDAVQDATKHSANPIKKFVVTGASKRGWTTWLAGAAKDKRIIGIAPQVFDFLNIPAQLKRQTELWGKPSERLGDYTDKGLDQVTGSPEGQKLVRLVDPYSYLSSYKAPTLIILGANDPYWATDGQTLYFADLPQLHSLLILPNEGHTFNHKDVYLSTLAAFARSCSGAFIWPQVSVATAIFVGERVEPSPCTLVKSELWSATTKAGDFRPSIWKVGPYSGPMRPSNFFDPFTVGFAEFQSDSLTFQDRWGVGNSLTITSEIGAHRAGDRLRGG